MNKDKDSWLKLRPNINFTSQIFYALALSIAITLGTCLCLGWRGLHLGIDFSGGLLFEMSLETTSIDQEVEKIRQRVTSHYPGAHIQHYRSSAGQESTDAFNIMVRIQSSQDMEKDKARLTALIASMYIIADANTDTDSAGAVTPNNPKTIAKIERLDYVGPKAGADFFLNGLKALGAAMVVMLIYIWCRFEWRFAVGVIISLLHDAFATIGFYSITGQEFDLTAVAAILTIVGYSVNDSVVIYDRIRRNLATAMGRHGKGKTGKKSSTTQSLSILKNLEEIINASLNETLSRTVMTVGTTLAVCASLVIYGGPALFGFSSAVLFGIAFGTYSSIYVSTGVLLPRSYFTIRLNRLLGRSASVDISVKAG